MYLFTKVQSQYLFTNNTITCSYDGLFECITNMKCRERIFIEEHKVKHISQCYVITGYHHNMHDMCYMHAGQLNVKFNASGTVGLNILY